MGGNVFTTDGPLGEPPLCVPRMTPEQYKAIRDASVAKLRTVYTYVAVPREAPGKTSHGDVDIHVALPTHVTTGAQLGELLGAERMDLTSAITHSYAVPLTWMPQADCKQYAQIDVHHPADGYAEWEMFEKGDGDLMQIVGKFLRFAGFTANDKGLHVRLREIESIAGKKASMLYLTHDVQTFMTFLGLDFGVWKGGFTSQQDLFHWCCGSRFFSAEAFEHGAERHRDRQRMRKREVFKHFASLWLPQNQHLCKATEDQDELRERALHEAITAFNKQVEYQTRLQSIILTEDQKSLAQSKCTNHAPCLEYKHSPS